MSAADKGRAAQFSVFFEHRASAKIDRKQLIDAFVDHVPKKVRPATFPLQHFHHAYRGGYALPETNAGNQNRLYLKWPNKIVLLDQCHIAFCAI